MEPQFDDDLRQLKNALRLETFRFILIGRNRYSIYKDISDWLHTTFYERPFLELHLEGKDYRQINDELVAFKKGIVLIPDFGWLFQEKNESICVAFNQRRDAFARLNIALICFIEPGEFIELPKKVPDWWSLRSLELDFYREAPEVTGEILDIETHQSSLGGPTEEQKQDEIQRLLRQVAVSGPNNKSLLRSLYSQIGTLWIEISHFEEAKNYFEKSLLISQQINDQPGESSALHNMGIVYQAQGDYSNAIKYYTQSLNLNRLTDNESVTDATLNNIGMLYQLQGNLNQALEYYEQSLRVSQQFNNKQGEATTFHHIGKIYESQNAFVQALEYYQQSLDTSQQISDLQTEASVMNSIALVKRNLGDYGTALQYFNDSLSIFQRIGDQKTAGAILNNIGLIYRDRGDYFLALEYYESSLAISQLVGNGHGEWVSLSNIALIYYSQGNHKKALEYLQKNLTSIRQIGDKRSESITINNIGRVYEELKQFERSLEYYQQSLNISQQIDDKNGLATSMNNMGALYFEEYQNAERAIPLLQQSYTMFTQIGSSEAQLPMSTLNIIRNQIGEERFNQIIQDNKDNPQSGLTQ